MSDEPTSDSELMPGLPSSEDFERQVEETAARLGVPPALSNPDRVKAQPTKKSHEAAERATGASRPGLTQYRGESSWYKDGGVIHSGTVTGRLTGDRRTYADLESRLALHTAYGPALTWFHHLSRAQHNDVEVSVHVRENTQAAFRGKIAPEPKLSELDQDGATRLRTVTIVLKSGGAPERRVTIDLGEIVALTEQLPTSKVETREGS